MAYRRVATSPALAEGEELTAAMVGIGMIFAAKAAKHPNIEDTLLAASVDGMDRDDLRVLAVLVTWLGAHHPWINADRLTRAVQAQPSDRVRVFWAAIAQWLHKDRRLARLRELYPGPRINLLRAPTFRSRVGARTRGLRTGRSAFRQASCATVPRTSSRLRPWPSDMAPTDAACSWAQPTERTCGHCSIATPHCPHLMSPDKPTDPSPPRGK